MARLGLSVALEAPTAYYRSILRYTDYDFIIGSQYVVDENYRKVFNASFTGRRRILDSGAFEGETLSVPELIEVAKELKPVEVVIPDTPGDMEATLAQWAEYESIMGEEKRSWASQAVVCGTDLKEWTDCYLLFDSDPLVACIGISYFKPLQDLDTTRWVKGGFDPREAARLQFLLGVTPPRKPIHLLGLADCKALPIYAGIPWIRSIDTSFPVQIGMNDCILQWSSQKPTASVDYTAEFDAQKMQWIDKSCETFRSMVNGFYHY